MRALRIALGIVTATASTAYAQQSPPQANPTTSFVMPDLHNRRSAGVELMLGGYEEVSIRTVELSGNIAVNPELAITFRAPYAWASAPGESVSGSGSVAAGVQYTRRTPPGSGGVALGGGAEVALPTSRDAAIGQLFHLEDLGRYTNNIAFRPHGDLRFDAGRAFFQAQAGLDLYVYAGGGNDEPVKLLHLIVGGGASLGHGIGVVAEITTVSDILEDNGGDPPRLFGLSAGLRYDAEKVAGGVRLYKPLDLAGFGPLNDVIAIGLDASARF